MLTPSMIARMDATLFLYRLRATVPGSGQAMPQEQIQSGFHFWSEFLTMVFPTLNNAGADDGVNRLTCQFKNGSRQIGLSNDFIDLATIAAPGRQRAVGVAGDPSNPLHIQGFPWPCLYESTSAIIADLRNASTTAQTIELVWTGYLIPTATVRDAAQFYQILAGENPGFGGPLPG